MENIKRIKRMLVLSIAMLAMSVFMAISYHFKIEAGTADWLTKVAYYVWICCIPVCFFSGIYHLRKINDGR